MLPKPGPIKLDPGILDWVQEVTDRHAVVLALSSMFYPGMGERETLELSAAGRIPGAYILQHLEEIREGTRGYVIDDDTDTDDDV